MANTYPRYKTAADPKTNRRTKILDAHGDPIVIGWIGEAYEGKRRIGRFTRPTKEEALALARKLEKEAVNGPLPGGLNAAQREQLTFGEYVDNHWDWRRETSATRKGVSERTLGRFRLRLKNDLRPRWEDVRLTTITSREAEKWYAKLEHAKISPNNLRQIHNTFSAILKDAIRDFPDILPSNPVSGLMKVDIEAGRKPIYPLNSADSKRFIEAMPTPGMKLYADLQRSTGFRSQEVEALLGRNHNHARCLITIDGRIVTPVSKDRTDGKTGPRRDPGLKDGSASHTMQLDIMDPTLNDRLATWIKDNNIGPEEPIFGNGLVRLADPSQATATERLAWMDPKFLRETWVATAKKTKLGNRFTPHQMRHTFATILLWERGVKMAVVASLLNDTMSVCERHYTSGERGYDPSLRAVG